MLTTGYDPAKLMKITCGPQGNNLLDLSPELHILVLSYLDPFDVLSARKASRALYRASNDRQIWISFLHDLCYDRDVYLPSYDLPKMSLSTLEKATCHPHLFENLLLRDNPNGTDHVNISLSSTVLDDTNAPDRNSIRNLYFIPGGRFLLGFSPKRIQIWDLIDPTQPRRISSMDLTRTGRILNTDVHCPESGRTVYLFAQLYVVPGTKYADQGYETALMVLELDLVNRRRLSRRIVGLRRGLMHISVAAEFLLALDYTRPSGEERFWGWDLSQHHFAKFTLGGRAQNGDGAGNWDLLIQGRQLVLYEFHARPPISCTVTVYPLPVFRKRSELVLQRLEPISKLSFNLPDNTVHVEFLLWCSFHCRQQLPGGVDAVVSTRTEGASNNAQSRGLPPHISYQDIKYIEYRMLQSDTTASPAPSEIPSISSGEDDSASSSSQPPASNDPQPIPSPTPSAYDLVPQGTSPITAYFNPIRCHVLVPTNRILQFAHIDGGDDSLRIHTVQFSKDRLSPGVVPKKSISRRLSFQTRDNRRELVKVASEGEFHLDTFSGRVAALKTRQDGRKDLQIFEFFPSGPGGRTWAVPDPANPGRPRGFDPGPLPLPTMTLTPPDDVEP